MGETPAAIGREQFRLRRPMSDERLGVTRVRRVRKNVALRRLLDFGALHDAATFSAPAGSRRLSTADQMAAATSFLADRRVDDDAAPRFGPRDVEKGASQRLVEREPLPFEPVGLALAPPFGGAGQTLFGGDVEDEREVGPMFTDRDLLQASDKTFGQLAGDALIGPCRIGEAVRDHPFSPFERRQNRRVKMVDAGGGEQKRLAFRPEGRGEAGQDRLAQDLGMGRAAGLARPQDPYAGSFQSLFETFGLHGFCRRPRRLRGL